MSEQFGESKGVAVTNWLVSKAAGLLERKSSRRGFILGSAMVGSAVAVAGCAPGTTPGTPYNHITDCAGGACTDGYTDFCCTVNNGLNSCPPNSFAGGWWRADYSSFCNGTRYYIDCMQNCCGPSIGNGFCAGCTECRCGGDCSHRRVYCNYFRYGQCHQEIAVSGPIACRVVTCTPPYNDASMACSTAAAVDNSTAEHTTVCPPPPPPPPPPFINAAVLPFTGATVAPGGGRIGVFGRRPDASISYAEFNGSTWGPTVNLGPSVDSGMTAVSVASGIYVFARGSFFGGVWYQRNAGGGWSDWQPLGGNTVSDPSAVSDPAGLFVFTRGGDDAIWYQRAPGDTGFAGFQSLGGGATSDPVGVSHSSGVYVFVRGVNNQLYYQRFASGSWSGWQSLGGGATSDCWAVSDPSGLYVFARGAANQLYYQRFASGSWSGWQSLGGSVTSDPYAISHSTGLYVFVRSYDNAVWYQRFASGSWSGWTSLGGGATAGPIAAGDAASGVFVFARGNDGALWYRRFVANTWTDWVSLGGLFAPVRGGR
ncbi:MAG: hypothetical protein QOF40_2247 [Actinomycetota bacterium]|nr:hypothetical protein [Actinomycetota bacterium]